MAEFLAFVLWSALWFVVVTNWLRLSRLRGDLVAALDQVTEARREVFALKGEVESLQRTASPPGTINRDSVAYWRNEIAQMVEDADYYGVKVTATAEIPLPPSD